MRNYQPVIRRVLRLVVGDIGVCEWVGGQCTELDWTGRRKELPCEEELEE